MAISIERNPTFGASELLVVSVRRTASFGGMSLLKGKTKTWVSEQVEAPWARKLAVGQNQRYQFGVGEFTTHFRLPSLSGWKFSRMFTGANRFGFCPMARALARTTTTTSPTSPEATRPGASARPATFSGTTLALFGFWFFLCFFFGGGHRF